MSAPLHLAQFTTEGLRAWLAAASRPVVIWPVGSIEPHGPHLPLDTDVVIAAHNADRAARVLLDTGIEAVVAPALPYGVTDFSEGFAGAVSLPAEVLIGAVTAAVDAWCRDGFVHVSIVNHHLEPGQLDALDRAVKLARERHGPHAVSLPRVTSRRWGAKLGAEFRSGACHAGEYETSLVWAARPDDVDAARIARLPPIDIRLSAAIRDGARTFLEAGADRAYVGRPADASPEFGHNLYDVLCEMVVTEVCDALTASQPPASPI